ncbi:hypothetical protein L9G16_21520, partial [Shewanella sp. A25]|nr:hypothetical protein [Shewanella shenzhenensis]
WRDNKWIVERNTAEVGAYAYRPMRSNAPGHWPPTVAAQGIDCYLLIRERDGVWSERPCPRPARRRACR